MLNLISKKLNKKGSTLVLALIIIAFLSVLATVMLSVSVTNIAMKQAANQSKITFYSAEAAVDEVYAGLGMTSMNSLSAAYIEVASTLVEVTEVGGVPVAIEIDNELANDRLKEYFVDNVFYTITGETSKGSNKVTIGSLSEADKLIMNSVKTNLKNFLSNPDGAEITDISEIVAEKKSVTGADVYAVTFKNVEIRYVTADGYFATVTVDIKVEFPDVKAGFANENGKLTAFAEYALIAAGNINFRGNSITVGNNVLANNNINVYNGAKVTFDGDGAVNIVSGKDITVDSNGYGASTLTINGCDIWAKNITLTTSAGSTGSILNIDGDSNSYIKDDLNINGQNSTATVGGNYYGYSYQGYSSDEGKPQDNSSAVIINGKKSKLSFEAINILIGGHAYINFGDTGIEAYMTGESLSIKGNQEIYLLMDQYINGTDSAGNPVQNPMSYEDWMRISSNNTASPINVEKMEKEFYAFELLNGEKPYIVKYNEAQKLYYVYLNFASKTDATKFFMSVISDKYFNSQYKNSTTVAQKEERNSLKTIMNENLVNMLGEEQSISIGSGANVFASGALFEVSTGNSIVESLVGTGIAEGGENYADFISGEIEVNSPTFNLPEITVGGVSGYDGFALSSVNYGNRFNILSHLCLDIDEYRDGKKYVVYEPYSTFSYKGEKYTVTTSNMSLSAADNAVDFNAVKANPYNESLNVVGGHLVAAIDGPVTVSNTVTGGIILATGDVSVSANFSGIIITQGSINVTGSPVITNKALNQVTGYENILPYLYAYRNTLDNDSDSIEEVRYQDIVKLSNWRKNEE